MIEHIRDAAPRCPAAGRPGDLGAIFKILGAQRAARRQLIQDELTKGAILFDPGCDPLRPSRAALAIATHHILVDGIIFDQHQRCTVRPIFKEVTIFLHQPVEIVAIIVAQPAPQHQILGAFDDANRVELQAAQLTDSVEHGRVRIGRVGAG